MTKRHICDGTGIAAHKPTEVLGCCDINYICPICKEGTTSLPHDYCMGWDDESLLEMGISENREIYQKLAEL